MKKNFFKKLALSLAFVMVATSVNVPAASAAAAPTFKSTKATVRVGQTKKYSASNASKYSAKFKIGKTSVATIKYSKGSKAVKVTGVAEGKTTLRADFTSYKTKKVTTVKIPVTVKAAKPEQPEVTNPEMASVKQIASNAFEVTFTADASKKITAESFTSIESDDKIYSAYIKSVEFSTDGLTAKVTVLNNFVDAKVYNVTCAEKTASFTASVGAVKTAVINTTQAQANVATDIEFTLYDANGIDVTPAVNVDDYVTLTVDGNYSDADTSTASKAKVTLSAVGDTATVTLTYDPMTTEDAIVTATGNIVGVATQATVGNTTYFTTGGDNVPKIYLKSFNANATIYEEEEKNFYFAAMDKNGNAIEYDEYKIESANENIITVGDNESESAKYAKFNVSPVKAGTAKVVIRATKNDVETVYSGTVTVRAAKKLTSIVLGKSSLTIGNGEEQHDTLNKMTVTFKDQYGNSMKAADVAPTVDVSGDTPHVAADFDDDYKVVVTPVSTGTSTVTISADNSAGKTITRKFSVTVKTVDTKVTPTFKLELSTNSIDLNPADRYDDNAEGEVTAKVAMYRGTVFEKYLDDETDVTIKDASGSAITNVYVKKGSNYYIQGEVTSKGAVTTKPASAGSILSGGAATIKTVTLVDGTSVDLKAGDGIAATGTYNVVAQVTVSGSGISNIKKSLTANLTVKNTMEMPTIVVNSTTGQESGIELVKECITVDIDVLADTDASIEEALDKDYNDATGDAKVNARYIKVKDTFGDITYHYYVPANKTFRTK